MDAPTPALRSRIYEIPVANRLMSLFTELKRRNVFRAGLTYGVLAWLLSEQGLVSP